RPQKKRAAGKRSYLGIVPRLEARLSQEDTEADVDRDDPDEDEGAIGEDDLGRFVVTRTCSACKGRRLRPEALAIKLGGRDIAELGRMPLEKLRIFLGTLGGTGPVVAEENEHAHFTVREQAVAEPLLRAVTARLG